MILLDTDTFSLQAGGHPKIAARLPTTTDENETGKDGQMQIPILIEPIEGGRVRVRAGEPFGLTAEAASYDEATRALEGLIAERLSRGARLGWINVPKATPPTPLPLPADELYKTHPSFAEMQSAIAEFRRVEDEEEERRWQATNP